MDLRCDYLVIGTGVAGLATSLKLADHGKVVLVAKCEARSTNTNMAQGGIASVLTKEDNFENHIQDTIKAGAGLCNEEVVRRVVEDAPSRIQDLESWGVQFDSDPSQEKDLTREGGHSHRRILHVQDQTGKAIQSALLEKAEQHPNIQILEDHMAMDLISNHDLFPEKTESRRAVGAFFLDIKGHQVINIFSKVTVLATGGAGKTYLYTSNWEGATGDGTAMSYRAGCRISNMEFMQFHPTCLFHAKARNFLISEALRGEGAKLVNKHGEEFSYKHSELGELAPRDIVARAIDAEMKETGDECVYLDIRHRGKVYIQNRFPVIYKKCLSLGYDLAESPLPVVPAAHYLCGGILTDLNGQTDIQGLFAVGECANTGLHGANRLASNSLLECLSFAHYSSEFIKNHPGQFPTPQVHSLDHNIKLHKENADEMILISHLWDEIRTCMWNYVGIVRSDKRLKRAKTRLHYIQQEIEEYYTQYRLHPDLIELRNLATNARLTVECALLRKHSIGTHFSLDRPPLDPGQAELLNIIAPNSLS